MQLQRISGPTIRTLAAIALLGVLTGCNNSSTPGDTSTPTETTTAAAGCADVATLKGSLEALTQVKPLQDGVSALEDAIANVKTDLDAALTSASSTLQPQVAQVKSAFTQLQTSVTGLTDGTLTQQAPAIANALADLGTATSQLATTLTQSCPGS